MAFLMKMSEPMILTQNARKEVNIHKEEYSTKEKVFIYVILQHDLQNALTKLEIV